MCGLIQERSGGVILGAGSRWEFVEDLSFVETDTHEGIALDVGYAGDNYIDYFLLFGMM